MYYLGGAIPQLFDQEAWTIKKQHQELSDYCEGVNRSDVFAAIKVIA